MPFVPPLPEDAVVRDVIRADPAQRVAEGGGVEEAARRGSVTTEPASRAATNALLTGLHEGRWRPHAWRRFLLEATDRSIRQARQRPRALAEITLLHALYAAIGPGKGRVWTVVSWALAATHLGMLEQHRSIGWASALTLTRANLPTVAGGRWLPVLALASDLADGWLARTLGTVSPFGAAADSLADAAFWTWYTLHHERDRRLRAAAVLVWGLPVIAVIAASVGRGSMVDAPRPVLLRPAAALQAALAVRALLSPKIRSEPGCCCE